MPFYSSSVQIEAASKSGFVVYDYSLPRGGRLVAASDTREGAQRAAEQIYPDITSWSWDGFLKARMWRPS